jgi:LPXTG-motif cell wall-anchored protein
VPSVCRRIVVLLVVALLGVGAPVTAAYAQGAGDQQYQDPFGNDDSGSGSNGSSNSGSGSNGSSNDDIEPLSPSPQTSGSGSGSGSSGSGTSGSGTSSGTAGGSATGTSTSATAGTLPNTGLDTRVLLLAGGVLVLLGVGLRMRNAPERF